MTFEQERSSLAVATLPRVNTDNAAVKARLLDVLKPFDYRFPCGCVGAATPFAHDQEIEMQLKGSKTEQNLKDAFTGESQANRRGRRQLS